MKNIFYKIILVVGLLIFSVQPLMAADKAQNDPASTQTQAEKSDTLAATVNNVSITKDELNKMVMGYLKSMRADINEINSQPEKLNNLQKSFLETMISIELFFQEANKQKLVVSKEQVDQVIDMVIKKYGTIDDFKKVEGEEGLELLMDTVSRKLLIDKLIDKEIGQNITEKEIKQYYDENKNDFMQKAQISVSHILIPVAKDASPKEAKEAEAKAKKILKKIKKGEDFAKLASENSSCPSKAKGGVLGFFSRGQMVPEFEEAAFNLKIDEISDIVKTSFGYHIIKKTGEKKEGQKKFEDVEEFIVQQLKGQKVKVYLEALKKNARIENFI